MTEVLQLVAQPRPIPEIFAAIRSWDPMGIDRWVLAASASLPISRDECRLFANQIDSLELSPAEFERVIAIVGCSLGLDYRRKLPVGKTIYGKDREAAVLFRDGRTGNRLAVEAKYHRVAATADENLPYTVPNPPPPPCPAL